MPATPWIDVAGQRCERCGNLATHCYGAEYLCCTCHGGNLVTDQEEIVDAHANAIHEHLLALWRANDLEPMEHLSLFLQVENFLLNTLNLEMERPNGKKATDGGSNGGGQ